jgi:hypothetical protein
MQLVESIQALIDALESADILIDTRGRPILEHDVSVISRPKIRVV